MAAMKEENCNILVIDDAPDNQILLTTLLEARGYNVHCTSNGEEALTLLRQSEVLPDLILLDIHMPVMDGYEFHIQQQGDPRLKSIPVVVMTGDDDESEIQELICPLSVLHKPFEINTFIHELSHNFIN